MACILLTAVGDIKKSAINHSASHLEKATVRMFVVWGFLNTAFKVYFVLFTSLLSDMVYWHTFLFVDTLLSSPGQKTSFIKGVNKYQSSKIPEFEIH